VAYLAQRYPSELADLFSTAHIIALMLNVKQRSYEYQHFMSFGLTQQGNRTKVYRDYAADALAHRSHAQSVFCKYCMHQSTDNYESIVNQVYSPYKHGRWQVGPQPPPWVFKHGTNIVDKG